MWRFISARTKRAIGTVAIAAAALFFQGCNKPKAPTANFTFSPSEPAPGDTVTFKSSTGGAYPFPTYSWDFGDGGTSALAYAPHVYLKAGTYNVTLTEKNSLGSSTATGSVTVAPLTPPTASFTFSPANPTSGRVVSFSNGSTGKPVPTYLWSFGDGATATATNPTHTYATPSSYSVKLTATNSLGSTSVTQSVNVSPGAPIADFTFGPFQPATGQAVTFTDASGQNPTSWFWEFDDGTTSRVKNPTHTYSVGNTYRVSLTATNAYGSSSVAKVLTVRPALQADFSFAPPNPISGQPVTFIDLSPGVPRSPLWSFGDGTTSTAQNPTHTYLAALKYDVTLTVTYSGVSSSVTKSLTVSPATRSLTLPVAGHVVGAGGVLFITEVEIENPNAVPVSADLLFFPVGSTTSSSVSLSLSPLETLSLPDVLSTQFGVTSLFGALRLDTQGSPPPLLRFSSRTYNHASGGALGTSIPGFVEAADSPAIRFVTGLQQNDEYRSALGALNASMDVESFQVLVHGSDGTVLGTSPAVSLAPNAQWQMSLAALFPSVSGVGLTAEFQPMPGSNLPFAYGTLAENISGDLSYFPSALPATTLYLPMLSKITGRGAALYSSEVTVSNVSDDANDVTFTFFEHDHDNTNGTQAAPVTLAAHETRLIPDVLALLGLSETYGAVKIESTSSVVVAARINTAAAMGSGVVGQEIDPLLPDGFYSQASIMGLRQDDRFRSNISLFNPNNGSVAVNLTLRRPNGELLSQVIVDLPPLGFREFNLAALFPGISFPPGESLTVGLDAGSSAVAACGSIADGASRDLIAAPALP